MLSIRAPNAFGIRAPNAFGIRGANAEHSGRECGRAGGRAAVLRAAVSGWCATARIPGSADATEPGMRAVQAMTGPQGKKTKGERSFRRGWRFFSEKKKVNLT
jgi:hypothetical protein